MGILKNTNKASNYQDNPNHKPQDNPKNKPNKHQETTSPTMANP